MRPRLKEDPKEWAKFSAATALFLGAISVLLRRRGFIGPIPLWAILSFLACGLVLCLFRPRGLRPIYRYGMTASFHVGQIVGRLLLGIFFICALTPLAVLLRLLGKDLLGLHKDQSASSYWQPGTVTQRFDRQF